MAKGTDMKINVGIYDKKHLNNLLKATENQIKLIDDAVKKASRIGETSGFKDNGKPFLFDDYPVVKARIDELLQELRKNLVTSIEEGNKEEWLLSCEKNDKMVDSIILSSGVSKTQISQWKQPNLSALNAFQARKVEGMGLSARVWNITDQLKEELELALDIGLGEGKSAAALSRDVRKFLKEPDKLFRRVRDKHGVLRLSKAAKAYHPGQGVYRSSYKNAMRLAATENNMAYRSADHERWKQLDFVIGIEIRTSNNHPVYDICDELKGEYPKDFKYVGWHPKCRCYAVAVLPTMEQFLEYQNKRLAGEDVSDFKFDGEIKDVPDNFKGWLDRNKERAKYQKNLPYFIKDNGKYVPKKWIDEFGSLAKKADKGIVTDVKEALYKLKEPTYVTEKEVRTMIENFAKAEPDLFYGGLSKVKVSKTGGAFMSCGRAYMKKDGSYYKKDGNILTIHNFDFKQKDALGNETIFNPLHEVKEAMKSISAKRDLTFNQEYAIESIWHEIRHAGAMGWKNGLKKHPEDVRAAMECINQFCARRSYGKFLRAIGGNVKNKKEIIEHGYGYYGYLKNWEKLLKTINVSSSEAYAHFNRLIMVEPYENIFGCIVDFLVSKGVKKTKAEVIVKSLRHTEVVFDSALMGV